VLGGAEVRATGQVARLFVKSISVIRDTAGLPHDREIALWCRSGQECRRRQLFEIDFR
jgi:rhodanese-related sulfurtransferase